MKGLPGNGSARHIETDMLENEKGMEEEANAE